MRGFTLVEMLVVITIIGIITALSYPNYKLLQENAYNTVARSDNQQFTYAAELLSAYTGIPDPIFLSGAGGPVPGLPGAVATEGTRGVIDVDLNHYLVETFHVRGSLCYRFESTAGEFAVLDPASCGA